MNILVLGSGGREHALAWKLAQSSHTEKLYVAPGNGGTAQVARNVSLPLHDFHTIGSFCLEREIGMLVVGPEEPLVKGICDHFRNAPLLGEILVIGPEAAAARLEGSKDYAKQFMMKYGIPTALYRSFGPGQLEEAKVYLGDLKRPYVLKADGLAAGKGVIICQDLPTAQDELQAMFAGKFGAASEKVVIEEFLSGREFSVFALTDGRDYRLLPVAKDYKRIGEGDTGLNTGGMGAISPVSFVDENLLQRIDQEIVGPTIRGIAREGMDYRGFLFFGLMEVNGTPYVIEYNVRLGDPEAEVVLPRLQSDLVELLTLTARGRLAEARLAENPRHAAAVMLVSEGYPEQYDKGKEIGGLDQVPEEESLLFHAGTREEGGKILTNGGRVMAVTSLAGDWRKALEQSYRSVNKLCFEGITYRKDLGFDL